MMCGSLAGTCVLYVVRTFTSHFIEREHDFSCYARLTASVWVAQRECSIPITTASLAKLSMPSVSRSYAVLMARKLLGSLFGLIRAYLVWVVTQGLQPVRAADLL